MKTAWEHIVRAAKNLHAQGYTTFSRQELQEEALRLGWSGAPVTLLTHITDHMRDDREKATHPYLHRVARNTYQLNEAGQCAALPE